MNGVMLGVEVPQVVVTGGPPIVKECLTLSVGKPVESHVHGFRFDLFACASGDSHGGGVVGIHGNRLLGVAEFE